ncbi:MAG TPA: FtsW/RodA/SpoVE family cell cycle protein [Candidatus Dorea intestinavium]|nr:FtsW/RodA/SpoVE family cell cycle protein [Candidatus Dorea intestinavium]
MVQFIVEISKYLIIVLIAIYTLLCFVIFGVNSTEKQKGMLKNQNVVMFLFHLVAFIVLYLEKEMDIKIFGFYLMQILFFIIVLLAYTKLYPQVSRLVLNNMCMLLCIGFVILTRLKYELALKQFIFASAGVVLSLIVPIIIRKFKSLAKLRIVYGVVGIISLGVVAVAGRTQYGAKLGFNIAGINIQPSELVKIVFVFFVASCFVYSLEFKDIVITTGIAALHVLILVASKDLGAALIIFIVYITMLYVATKQPLYLFAGMGAGAIASYFAYRIFSHVQVRVNAWRDPMATYETGGYQVAQSLFAIGTGSWIGRGLMQGDPKLIPVAESDFVFSAIAEELGLVFAICLILICISVYIMFLNIAMELRNGFYRLVALGLGTCYIFQVFLTVGGVTKFIPSTGVTLPLISYGGSSLLSTLIMFAIIQGLYIVREDEEEDIEQKKRERLKRNVKKRAKRI